MLPAANPFAAIREWREDTASRNLAKAPPRNPAVSEFQSLFQEATDKFSGPGTLGTGAFAASAWPGLAVRCVDYGTALQVGRRELHRLPPGVARDTEGLALCCRLAGQAGGELPQGA